MHGKKQRPVFWAGQTVVLRYMVTDEDPASTFTPEDVTEVTFRVRNTRAGLDATLSMTGGDVSLSGGEFVANYFAERAGQYTVTATARDADGKRAVDVTEFEVREP